MTVVDGVGGFVSKDSKKAWQKPLFTVYRQSAKLFLKSSELGLPQLLTRRGVCPPPPPVQGGGRGTGTHAGERGVGRVPVTTRGHTLSYSIFQKMMWNYLCKYHSLNNVHKYKIIFYNFSMFIKVLFY